MNYPKIIFTTNKKEEAHLLCFTAKNIQLGYFQKANMFVLPYKVTKNNKTVYFPDWFDSEFWKLITKHKEIDYGHPYSSKLNAKTLKILNDHPHDKSFLKRAKVIQKKWKQIEKEFFSLCKKFLKFDEILGKIETIEILQTPFGTAGSFYPLKKGDKYHIKISARIDMPASYVCRLILLNLYKIKTNSNAKTGEVSWYERMAVVKFLTRHSIFSKFKKESYVQTPISISKTTKHSKSYLDKLGFTKKGLIDLSENNQIKIKGKRIVNTFTTQEKPVLKALIKSKNEVIGYDKLSEILWGENADEKFSIQAMAKLMENIKSKLSGFGLRHDLIRCERGKGYILLD